VLVRSNVYKFECRLESLTSVVASLGLRHATCQLLGNRETILSTTIPLCYTELKS